MQIAELLRAAKDMRKAGDSAGGMAKCDEAEKLAGSAAYAGDIFDTRP